MRAVNWCWHLTSCEGRLDAITRTNLWNVLSLFGQGKVREFQNPVSVATMSDELMKDENNELTLIFDRNGQLQLVNSSLPENDQIFMLSLLTSVSWPSFYLTTMRSLVIVFGPYSASTFLHSFRDPHLCAVRPREAKSCSVFLTCSSQWSVQIFTSAISMSMKMRRESRTPVQLDKQR